MCCYYWNFVHCLYIHKFWVSEGIVTGCLFLPPTVCYCWKGVGLHDVSCEFGACHTVCVSSYHARITRWFNEYCTIILCLFISFFYSMWMCMYSSNVYIYAARLWHTITHLRWAKVVATWISQLHSDSTTTCLDPLTKRMAKQNTVPYSYMTP